MGIAAGTKLGSYEISAPLGAGGMGEVYRARDSRLARDVALKVLPSAFASDAERMGRFEREAKVLASLNHPNIAAIYGFEDSSGVHALVMELVEGPTLADRIGKGAIPIEEALPIAKQIAEGLEYAHERGVVHRDLKPANIKLTCDGAVKILDFGLAKAIEGEATPADISSSPTLTRMATQAGMILGTAAYMSPEQAKGKSVDRRTDIWAFGCVLYEMLTGKQAFPGETVTDVLANILKVEPDWSQLPSATPAHVCVLLRRCLQKESRQRLRDIGDARLSLEEVLTGSPESFSTAGISFPLVRRALPWALGGLFVGATITTLILWKLNLSKPQSAMHFRAVTNFAGVQAQPAISPDGRSVAFVSDRDGSYNIYVGLLSGGNLVQITHDANAKAKPAWSPDGTTIAYARLNASGLWDIWEVPALGGTARRVIQNAKDPAWSPDGTSLAYESGTDLGLWISGISGENAHQLAMPSELFGQYKSRQTEPRFSPDGRQLAFVQRGNGPYGQLDVIDLQLGKVRVLTDYNALVLTPVWSPDGRFIYFASSRGGTINIWKMTANGDRPEQITAGQGDDAQLDLSSDGKKIVFSTWRTKSNITELTLAAKSTDQVRLLAVDPARNQVAPVYSPDGKYLTYFSNLKGAEREAVWVANADGSNPVQMARDDRIDVHPNWAPDSRQVVYDAESFTLGLPDELRIVPVSGGVPEPVVACPDRYFDVGSDGRILFRDDKHHVQTFDLRTHKTETLGTIQNAGEWAPLRWSPDQRFVAYVVAPKREDDADAGVWVTDFKNPPRQLFRGWADWWISRGPDQQLYFLKGTPELKEELWRIGRDGRGLAHVSAANPMTYSYWVDPSQNPQDRFTVSPDGRHVAFETQTLVEANIGMLENVR